MDEFPAELPMSFVLKHTEAQDETQLKPGFDMAESTEMQNLQEVPRLKFVDVPASPEGPRFRQTKLELNDEMLNELEREVGQ